MSAFMRIANSSRTSRYVRKVPILLKKSFLTSDRNFSGPLMRFVRQDVRDHIGSFKNDHGHSYLRQRPLQRWRRRKLLFREILGVVRFSTFSTISDNSGHSATHYIMSRARDQNWGPTYLRRLMSDCPCSGNSSVGVTWPTSMPGVTDVLMYFISPAANWNVTAFSTSVAVVTAYFPGGRST